MNQRPSRVRERAAYVAALVATTVGGASCATQPRAVRAPEVTFDTVASTTTVVANTAPASTQATVDTTTSPAVPTTLVPDDSTVDLAPVATGLTAPVDLAVRRGDTSLYVAQQGGQVLELRTDGQRVVVLDLHDDISTGGERGLLGIAFAPAGDELVVSATDLDGNTLVTAYSVAADGMVDPTTRRLLYTAAQPFPNHNGGDVAFGPDGMLYLGLGDGGAAGDPGRRALDVSSPLGKILRLDPRSSPSTAAPDNPFAGVAGALDEVWAVGLRNPWRFSFDSATGDLWIADVGQDEWEEVDVARAAATGHGAGRGMNFGWSALEGTHRFNTDQSSAGVTPPVVEYAHGRQGCSVSGGVVVRDGSLLDGWYVFADYCSGVVRAILAAEAVPGQQSPTVRLGVSRSVTAVCSGPDGSAYVLAAGDGSAGAGSISRVVPG